MTPVEREREELRLTQSIPNDQSHYMLKNAERDRRSAVVLSAIA